MQTCSNCRSNQLDGTIFCSECGASLLMPRRQETTASLAQAAPLDIPQTTQPTPIHEPINDSLRQPAFVLVILNSGRRIELDLSEDLLIGRKDVARGIVPDIDLDPDGGFDAGVSRRHAILAYRNGAYQVEDLDSANGTFVNGKRVLPQTPTSLVSGDELTCGMLLMRVETE